MEDRPEKLKRPNRAQDKALFKLYVGSSYVSQMSFMTFRRRAVFSHYEQCLFVDFFGMTVGIETDGYMHS